MTNVFDVAKYILGNYGEFTAMKLQKLCYYSQAWSLLWDEEPLFEEEIQAWANGPIIPDLYQKHKGKFKISREDLDVGDSNNLSKNQKRTINKVVKFYNKFNPQQLSDLTHMEDPWLKARKGLNEGERGNNEITLESMAEYYESL